MGAIPRLDRDPDRGNCRPVPAEPSSLAIGATLPTCRPGSSSGVRGGRCARCQRLATHKAARAGKTRHQVNRSASPPAVQPTAKGTCQLKNVSALLERGPQPGMSQGRVRGDCRATVTGSSPALLTHECSVLWNEVNLCTRRAQAYDLPLQRKDHRTERRKPLSKGDRQTTPDAWRARTWGARSARTVPRPGSAAQLSTKWCVEPGHRRLSFRPLPDFDPLPRNCPVSGAAFDRGRRSPTPGVVNPAPPLAPRAPPAQLTRRHAAR